MYLREKLAWVTLVNLTCSFLAALGAIPCPSTWQKRDRSEYYFRAEPMPWSDAKRFCQEIHAELVMPLSAEENAFVQELLLGAPGASRAWLNCHRDGQWQCVVDGVGQWPPFNNPDPLQPEVDGNCITVQAENAKWQHTYCNGEASPVCERKATRRVSPVKYCLTTGADGRLTSTSGQCLHDPKLM